MFLKHVRRYHCMWNSSTNVYFFIVDLKRTCDKYCKPTSIREDIISRFTEHKLVRDD